MMTSITPDVNAYGTYGRESTLADYLEIQALRRSRSMSKEELGDMIRDNTWQRYDFVHSADNTVEMAEGNLVEAVEAAAERADLVFELLKDRFVLLGERYPFELDAGRLRLIASDNNPYLRLLAITTCHAYNLVSKPDPRLTFESMVTETLKNRGFLASNVGGHAYHSPNFVAALSAVGKECQLDPTPEMAIHRKHAQDEGVDFVAHLSWSDRRPIHWVYIGQATCAKSDQWTGKIKEPSSSQWKDLLGLMVRPRSLLAVPHHIPSWHMTMLAQDGEEDRLILDRVRLSGYLAQPLPCESPFLAIMNSLELEIE